MAEKASVFRPVRPALGMLWTLNFKAMPSALLWSTSLFVSIQTPSLVVRLVSIFLCSIAAILGSHLILRSQTPSEVRTLSATIRNRGTVAVLAISGVAFAITLENVTRYSHSGFAIRLLMVSNFVSVLLLWFFIQVVVIPIRLASEIDLSNAETFKLSVTYVVKNKKSLLISLLALLLGWPLFFFYFLLALTFAQAMTFSTIKGEEWFRVGN